MAWYVEQRSTAGYLGGASCARFSVCENRICPLDASADGFTPPKLFASTTTCCFARRHVDVERTLFFGKLYRGVMLYKRGQNLCTIFFLTTVCRFQWCFTKSPSSDWRLINVCRKRKAALWNTHPLSIRSAIYRQARILVHLYLQCISCAGSHKARAATPNAPRALGVAL
jgi:hypothetical protein